MATHSSYISLEDLGEDTFRTLCAKSGLTCSKTDRDRMGWDFFVEFPQTLVERLPLDRQQDLKKAFVQVKATRRRNAAVRGKLAAFKKLVDTDLPAFIVRLCFHNNNEIASAQLLHVSSSVIELVLKKTRNAEAQDKLDIHKQEISISMRDATQLSADGANLGAVLGEKIGHSLAAYAANKANIRKSCGYDERPISAKFTVIGTADDIANFMIRKSPSLKVRNMTVEKRRFGIVVPKDVDQVGEATLSFADSPQNRATCIICNEEIGSSIELGVDIHSTAAINLPIEYRRLRFVNDCVDLVCHFDSRDPSFSFCIQQDEQHTSAELMKRLQIAILLTRPGTTINILSQREENIEFAPPGPISDLLWAKRYYELLELITIAQQKSRPGLTINISLSDLTSVFENEEEMIGLLFGSEISFTTRLNPANNIAWPNSAEIVYPVAFPVSSFFYTAILKAPASLTFQPDGSVTAKGGQPQLVFQKLECDGDFLDRLRARTTSISTAIRDQTVAVLTLNIGHAET